MVGSWHWVYQMKYKCSQSVQVRRVGLPLYKLGGCPFHGRVEPDEIPTRESPPTQSGTLPCPALPSPSLASTPLPSPPLHSLPSACMLLCLSMHTVCEVGELNWIGPLCLAYPVVAVRQWLSRPSSRCYFNGPLLHSAYILHSKYCFSQKKYRTM